MQKRIVLSHLLSMQTIFDRIADRFPEYANDSDMEGEEGVILQPFKNFSFCVSVNVDPRYALHYVSVDIAYTRTPIGYQTSIYIDADEQALDIVSDLIFKSTGGLLEADDGTLLQDLPLIPGDMGIESERVFSIVLKDVLGRLNGSLLASIDPGLVLQCKTMVSEVLVPRT